jgi:hypothetical protein
MTPSNPGIAIAAIARRPISRQHRNAVFTALLSYAKITPAALHCSDCGLATTGGSEAADGRPEFGFSNFRRINAGATMPAAPTPWMAPS